MLLNSFTLRKAVPQLFNQLNAFLSIAINQDTLFLSSVLLQLSEGVYTNPLDIVITNDLQMVPWQAKLMVNLNPNVYLPSHKQGIVSKCV